jgi:Flp pilus assembly protein TadB
MIVGAPQGPASRCSPIWPSNPTCPSMPRAAAASLHFMLYNFARPHQTLNKAAGRPTTPAVAAGVARYPPSPRSRLCLTDHVPRGRPPMTPEQQGHYRRFVIFSWIAAVIVVCLALAAISHGTLRTIAAIVGVPVLAVLLVVARRLGARIKR